jgi:hypothetical protein
VIWFCVALFNGKKTLKAKTVSSWFQDVSGFEMIQNDSNIFKPFVFSEFAGRTRGCQGQASSASTMLASQVDVLSRFMVRFMFVVGICWDLWMLDLGPSWAILGHLGLLGPRLIETYPTSPKVAGASAASERSEEKVEKVKRKWKERERRGTQCMARGFQRSGEAELDSGGLNVRTRLSYRARKVHPIESNNSMLVQLRSRLPDTMTPSKHVY